MTVGQRSVQCHFDIGQSNAMLAKIRAMTWWQRPVQWQVGKDQCNDILTGWQRSKKYIIFFEDNNCKEQPGKFQCNDRQAVVSEIISWSSSLI